ncbi:MAG: helix-turn-helix transcriptional regulator [Verrucomicrobiota bacterium]
MVKVIHDNSKFDYEGAFEKAREQLGYWQEDILLTVARRIIDEMDDQDVSRAELARRMDVSPAYITKILRGHANLSLESLASVAFSLNKRWECVMTDFGEQYNSYCVESKHTLALGSRNENAAAQAAFSVSTPMMQPQAKVLAEAA